MPKSASTSDRASVALPQLDANVTRVELPSDRGRCGGEIARSVIVARPGPSYVRTLTDAASDLGASLFDLGLATFVVLLHRQTQQAEITVGARQEAPRPDASDATAPSNDRIVRVEFTGDSTFAATVAAVRRELERAEGMSERDVSAAVSALFVLSEAVGEDRSSGTNASVDVVLTLEPRGGDLTLRLEYDRRLFRPERMRELLAQYQLLSEQAAKTPSRPILDHSLVTELGRSVLPDPTRAIDRPRHQLLPEAVVACADRRPTDVAVRQAGRTWSYAELAGRSSALAFHLRGRGAGPGVVVAVTGRRSFALVSSMLGVFRSGATLLTLDPKLPLERQKVMIEQASAKVLVSVGDPGELARDGLELVAIDSTSGEVLNGSSGGAGPLPAIDPESPAYVFFTSGSTGIPKAVRGKHAGLAHFLDWQRRTFEVGPGDRASQLTALSFDVILRDMFLALTSGATLCIPAEEDVIEPGKILSWMEREQITILHVVPSLARLWLNHVPPGVSLSRLRRVFFAGEPLTDVLVNRFREAFGSLATVVNLYGPTETTLAKCFHRVTDPEPGVQPIGHPMPQTQALILNARRQLCGLNETGEIAIRTPFRTFGYLNSPEANARAFIPNPFRDDPDDLVYLTGDSGRYRTDGLLEILGRIDNQVKIRGMRVEPGEIEAALGHYPDVREAVVAAREDEARGKFLVAYVVPRTPRDRQPSGERIAGLREFLRQRLPEHMVPAAFVFLDTLPLNPNGKVNKKVLPAPDRTSLTGGAYVPPSNDLETELVSIWRRLLKLDQVGIDDRFFDIGGDSLLGVQLTLEIEAKLGRPCPLPLLFETGTIRSLAARLQLDGTRSGSKEEALAGSLVPLHATGSGPQLFCICGVHLYQHLADRLAPGIRTYGIFLPYEQELFRDANQGKSALSVEEMAAGYLRMVRMQQPDGPYLLAGVSFGGLLAFEMAQQLRRAGERVALLAILDTMLPGALHRDWGSWAFEKLRQLRDRGLGRLVSGAASRFRLTTAKGKAHERAGSLDAVEEEARRLGEIRETIYRDATHRYRPERYPGAALLLRAEDKSFFESDVADETYGWRSLIEVLVTHDVPGDHIGMLSEPHVAVLAERIATHLIARGSAQQVG